MTRINIAGIIDHSTVDYLGKISAVIYLCGCNFRCPWCQNRDLVLCNRCYKEDIKKILKKINQNFLINSVSITGGEPLMQTEVVDLLKAIKSDTGLLIKIDTNGYFPENLKRSLNYLDFITIDVKAPLNERYGKVVGISGKCKDIVEKIKKTLSILKEWRNPKEVRTTIVPGLIDSEDNIRKIAKIVNKNKFNYYTLQQFRARITLDPEFEKIRSPTRDEMLKLGKIAKEELSKTKVQIVTLEGGFEVIR